VRGAREGGADRGSTEPEIGSFEEAPRLVAERDDEGHREGPVEGLRRSPVEELGLELEGEALEAERHRGAPARLVPGPDAGSPDHAADDAHAEAARVAPIVSRLAEGIGRRRTVVPATTATAAVPAATGVPTAASVRSTVHAAAPVRIRVGVGIRVRIRVRLTRAAYPARRGLGGAGGVDLYAAAAVGRHTD